MSRFANILNENQSKINEKLNNEENDSKETNEEEVDDDEINKSFIDIVFNEKDSKKSIPSKPKKSKLDKYEKLFQPEFDEEQLYLFLNENKLKFDPKLRPHLKNFMLVYQLHIDYDIISKHINEILYSRKNYEYTAK